MRVTQLATAQVCVVGGDLEIKNVGWYVTVRDNCRPLVGHLLAWYTCWSDLSGNGGLC